MNKQNLNVTSIWGVGRNYSEHAAELSNPLPTSPLIFLKSGQCLSTGNLVEIPRLSERVDHEIELAVQLDENLEPYKLALALDLTARDWQTEAKNKGLPWTQAKSFKNSCPVSDWITFQGFSWFENLEFYLDVNGERRQSGHASQMIFKLPTLLEHLKTYFPVSAGDIILTGTPSGVGPLCDGDKFDAQCGSLKWSGVCKTNSL